MFEDTDVNDDEKCNFSVYFLFSKGNILVSFVFFCLFIHPTLKKLRGYIAFSLSIAHAYLGCMNTHKYKSYTGCHINKISGVNLFIFSYPSV